MFFIMGIDERSEELEFTQTVICSLCGRYGRYQVFMTCTVLSLFFIPLFKWNRRFLVQLSCCDATYELDPEVGKRIQRGEQVTIEEADLKLIRKGRFVHRHRCENCGYETDEDFDYCPKCGKPF